MQTCYINKFDFLENKKLLSIIEGSLSSVLQCNRNPKFSIPPLPIFMEEVIQNGKLSKLIIIVALMYVYRLKEKISSNKIGEYETPYKIFLASILIATKYLQDKHECKSINVFSWCKGQYSLLQINNMERTFLISIDYNLEVNKEQILVFCKEQLIDFDF